MEIADIDDVDPRRVRSRARLLDAAATLLSSGGVEAVTVEAVTRLSRVARTTLYRHFESTTDLVAAAFERLLPQVDNPETSQSIRDDLVRNDQDLWIWEGVPSRKYDPGSHLIKSALQRWR
ncbi:TetR/AcrR family transcriptional regulator, partial [Gordonia bronchialis]|uniref:TetR/AcrR family transcriptional regulator n=1 Tax=Gordonia bronchialis TaxID=2054 RepID=UPI00226FE38B